MESSFFWQKSRFLFSGPKTMYYSPWFSFLGVEKMFEEKDAFGKGTSRGAEWCQFFIAPSSEEL